MPQRLPPALQVRDFRFLWTAIFSMRFAENMIAVAIGWQVFAIRKDPLDLGLIGLAEFVPLLVLALPAGHIADRLPRRVVAACALTVMAGVSIGLLGVTLAGADVVWPYYVLAAVTGAASATGWPAYQALTPEVVPPDLVAGAVALRSVAGQVAVISGPAVGGLIFAWKAEAVYAVAAALFGVAGISMAALHVRPARGDAPVGVEGLVEGIRFVWRTRMLLGAITLDLFAVLVGGGIALLPIYARDILHVGPAGLGVLRAAPALGALGAALILARRPLRRSAGPTLITVVVLFGAANIVWGASRWLPISLGALAVAGFVDMISVNIRSTTVALVTPNELRGRVGAVEMVFISASNELGAFESGAVAAGVGAVATVVAGGIATIGCGLAAIKTFPDLARMGRLEELRPEPAGTLAT
ncbi:MAG TPA: MFS transporter [Gaiellaceae bacterium]|nr:MFS transporter [Gaiellaceae bacterium]